MQTHVFVAEPFGIEIAVVSATYREAHKKAWDSLTHEQQDNLECLDYVDNFEVTDDGDAKCPYSKP